MWIDSQSTGSGQRKMLKIKKSPNESNRNPHVCNLTLVFYSCQMASSIKSCFFIKMVILSLNQFANMHIKTRFTKLFSFWNDSKVVWNSIKSLLFETVFNMSFSFWYVWVLNPWTLISSDVNKTRPVLSNVHD